jgi:elongation factor G
MPIDDGPLASLVFKIATDPYVGKVSFVRVYSGVIQKGHNIYNPRTKKREKITRLVRLHADSREDIESLCAGDIGGICGLKQATTGDTLCAENAQVELEKIRFPEPVMFMAIEPRTRADRDKLMSALESLASEDPTCNVRLNEETGQTIISGMGELHLEIVKDRILREFKVEANAGRPTVAYHETISGSGRSEFVFDRELGGKRQFAKLIIEVSACGRGEGIQVEFHVSQQIIPEPLREHIALGIQDALMTGVLARYSLTDINVKVVGGAVDPDASTDVAFRTAAVMAVREAVTAAVPELLEPVMLVEIVTPSDHLGDILGDLTGRRGKVLEMLVRGDMQIVKSGVPLAEMFGYSTAIRSLSRGRASYTMEPKQFDVVPKAVKETLLNR